MIPQYFTYYEVRRRRSLALMRNPQHILIRIDILILKYNLHTVYLIFAFCDAISPLQQVARGDNYAISMSFQYMSTRLIC